MTSIESRPDIDLEELFEESVPCGHCSAPALLRSFCHNCTVHERPFYLCFGCFIEWYTETSKTFITEGELECECGYWTDVSVDDFSYYREF